MAVKDENSLVLQQLKHPQDVETSEEKKIRYRLEWAIKEFLSFYVHAIWLYKDHPYKDLY